MEPVASPPPAPAAAGATVPAGAAPIKGATVRLREDLIHPDPLLDCLVELCRLHGQAATRASLSAALPLRDGRLTLELAERGRGRTPPFATCGFAIGCVQIFPSVKRGVGCCYLCHHNFLP